jgi:hypothetical protein
MNKKVLLLAIILAASNIFLYMKMSGYSFEYYFSYGSYVAKYCDKAKQSQDAIVEWSIACMSKPNIPALLIASVVILVLYYVLFNFLRKLAMTPSKK